MSGRRSASRIGGLVSLMMIISGLSVAVAPAGNADPGCLKGGVLSIFARGSQDKNHPAFNTGESAAFYTAAERELGGIHFQQVDLGNLDGDNKLETGEYPAVGFPEWGVTSGFGGYYQSVETGWIELAGYLEERSARCSDEIYLLGGYSQGAEVVGYAINAVGSSTRKRIGYVALFGDPRFNPGCVGRRHASWARGSADCRSGLLGARQPYLPADLVDRAGSWCDSEDGICDGDLTRATWPFTAHDNYPDRWIPEAAAEAGPVLRARLGALPLPTF